MSRPVLGDEAWAFTQMVRTRGSMAPMAGSNDTGSRADPKVDHPAWARLVDQLAWYSRKSGAAQRAFTRLKVVELVIATAVPVVAAARGPALLTAALGAVVVVLEGVQQLFQWQTNWVLYRSTVEALKHQKFLFLSCAGPYAVPIPCGCWRSGRGPTTSCMVSGTGCS